MRDREFGVYSRPGHPLVSEAIAGFKALGFRARARNPSGFVPESSNKMDGSLVFGARGRYQLVAEAYSSAGLPVLLWDLPHLRFQRGAVRITPWGAGQHWLPEGDCSPARLSTLGVDIKPRRRSRPDGPVVVIGQVGRDSSHNLGPDGMQAWYRRAIADVRQQLPDKTIVFRPHPKEPNKVDGADQCSDPAQSVFAEVLKEASLIVTYCSTCGLEAMLEGVPVAAYGHSTYQYLATDPEHMASAKPVSKEALRPLLARIAWTQWTRDEISDGTAYRFVLDQIEKERALQEAA